MNQCSKMVCCDIDFVVDYEDTKLDELFDEYIGREKDHFIYEHFIANDVQKKVILDWHFANKRNLDELQAKERHNESLFYDDNDMALLTEANKAQMIRWAKGKDMTWGTPCDYVEEDLERDYELTIGGRTGYMRWVDFKPNTVQESIMMKWKAIKMRVEEREDYYFTRKNMIQMIRWAQGENITWIRTCQEDEDDEDDDNDGNDEEDTTPVVKQESNTGVVKQESNTGVVKQESNTFWSWLKKLFNF